MNRSDSPQARLTDGSLSREPLLSLRHITMDFPGVRALEDVSLDLMSGEVHALVGENGAGKSTLIKIIAGVWPYGSYEGEIRVNGVEARFRHVRDSEQHQIRIIYQELSLVGEMTVAENIFLGHEPTRGGILDRVTMICQAERILQHLRCAIPPETPVHRLTIGEQQIIEIAKALSQEARVLVLDEPTAALPERDVEHLHRLLRDLRDEGIGILYISHKLDEIHALADRVTVLRNGRRVAQFGRGQYNLAMLVRSMIGHTFEEVFPLPAPPRDTPLLTLEEVTLARPDPAAHPILEQIGFTCHEGEIVGLAGLLGSGRTALFSLLFGTFRGRWEGRLMLGDAPYHPTKPKEALRRGVALVTEDRKQYGLFPTSDVAENLSLASLGQHTSLGLIRHPSVFQSCLRQIERLAIKTPSLDFPGLNLSGGNQQKVILGRLLSTRPRLLLLDDPTRGIDVGAKQEVYRLIIELASTGIGVIFASSELAEVLGISHRILVLRDGRIIAQFGHGEASEADVLALAAGVESRQG